MIKRFPLIRFCSVVGVLVLAAMLSGFSVASASAQVSPRTSAQKGPSGSAARFASEATAYQNKIINAALASAPAGTRTSASEVKWPNGAVLGVPASPATDGLLACLNAITPLAFCSFSQPNYYGYWLASPEASGGNYWVPWGLDYPGQGVRSWFNQTEYRVWREQFQNHGNLLCISPWPYGNYYNPNYTGANVYDYWNMMSTNPNKC